MMTDARARRLACLLFLVLPCRPLAQEVAAPPPQTTQTAQTTTSRQTLTLPQCLEQAATRHPSLLVARSRIEGAEQLRQYAGNRPNPTVTLQTENWRFTGEPAFKLRDDLDVFVFGTQTFERGGKAARRRELAEQAAAVAQAELEVLKRRIQQDVLRHYAQAVSAQAALDVLGDNRLNLVQLVNYNEVRVREGYTAEGELIRARLEMQTAAAHEATAAQELERQKLDLLKAMGETRLQSDFALAAYEDAPALPASSASGAAAMPAALATLPVLADLLQTALANRPELGLLRARREQAKAALRLARANARQDLSVSFGYKRTENFNTLIGSVSIPLPLFDKNQGEIGQTAAEVAALEHELLVEENFVRAEVQTAYRTVENLRARLLALQSDFLLQADDARDVALAAYREGAADLYKVLEAQRARNDARLLYTRTLYDYRLSLVELRFAAAQQVW